MPNTSVRMNSPAARIDRSTCDSGGKVHDDVGRLHQRRGDRRVGDVALDEAMPRAVDHVAQVLEAARVGQLVERRDVPVRCAACAQRTKFEPMNPAPPVTRISTTGSRPRSCRRA